MSDTLEAGLKQRTADVLSGAYSGRIIGLVLAATYGEIDSPINAALANRHLNSCLDAYDPSSVVPRFSPSYSTETLRNTIPDLIINEPAKNSFEVTPLTRRFAAPFGALMAQIGLEHPNVSPYGIVSSPANRGSSEVNPFDSRRSIYGALLSFPDDVTVPEIAETSGVDEHIIHDHLVRLKQQGVVVGDSKNGQRDFVSDYKLNDAPDSITANEAIARLQETNWRAKQVKLARRIIGHVNAHPEMTLSVGEILDSISDRPATISMYFATNKALEQRARIVSVMDHLADIGLLKPTEEAKLRNDSVRLVDREPIRKYMEGVLRIILLEDEDFTEHYREVGREYAKSPEILGQILDMDFHSGALTRKRKTIDYARELAAHLKENGQITYEQGAKLYGIEQDKFNGVINRVKNVIPLSIVSKGKEFFVRLGADYDESLLLQTT